MARRTRIFISYRRSEQDGAAALLHGQLSAQFGAANVFMDQQGLLGGDDYRRRIVREIQECEVMVVVIGANWMGASKKGALNRLHEPEDYVRFEVGLAIDRDLLIIPVLVNDAVRPSRQELPDTLWRLTTYNDLRIRLNDRPGDVVQRLVASIKAHKKDGGSTGTHLKPWLWAGAAAVLLFAGAFWALRSTDPVGAGPMPRPDTLRVSVAPVVSSAPDAVQERSAGNDADRPSVPKRSALPECMLDGVVYTSAPFNRDEVVVAIDGSTGYATLSGQLSGRSVTGRLRPQGRSLMVASAPEGDLVAGSLTLDADCRHLKGNVSLRSRASGGTVNVKVDMYDKARGR